MCVWGILDNLFRVQDIWKIVTLYQHKVHLTLATAPQEFIVSLEHEYMAHVYNVRVHPFLSMSLLYIFFIDSFVHLSDGRKHTIPTCYVGPSLLPMFLRTVSISPFLQRAVKYTITHGHLTEACNKKELKTFLTRTRLSQVDRIPDFGSSGHKKRGKGTRKHPKDQSLVIEGRVQVKSSFWVSASLTTTVTGRLLRCEGRLVDAHYGWLISGQHSCWVVLIPVKGATSEAWAWK